MLAEKMAANAQGRSLRTDEVERYRVRVSDVLPHVEADQRDALGLRMKWSDEGLMLSVEAAGAADFAELVRLTSTPQHFSGRRWWFICSKCGGRCTSLYWFGHGRRGWWQCRGCCGLRYASSSLHRTPEGDRMILRGEIQASFPAMHAAMKREARRRGKALGSPSLIELPASDGQTETPATWAEVRAQMLASAGIEV